MCCIAYVQGELQLTAHMLLKHMECKCRYVRGYPWPGHALHPCIYSTEAERVFTAVHNVKKAIFVLVLIIHSWHESGCHMKDNRSLVIESLEPRRHVCRHLPEGGIEFCMKKKMACSGVSFILFLITDINWATERSAGTRYLEKITQSSVSAQVAELVNMLLEQ